MSYFDYKRIAKGYALNRPVYHIEFMEVVKQQLGVTESLEKGLDVGCGAGSSTIALGKLCKNVIGIDASKEMILAAKQYCEDESMEFICCRAEDVNLEDDTIDIITAAGSMNWVDENIFLGKAHKLLKNERYFIVYDNSMVNKMEGEPAFTRWWEEEYLRKFPKPVRKEED